MNASENSNNKGTPSGDSDGIGKTILVVDDVEIICEWVAYILRQVAGQRILMARDACEAKELMLRIAPEDVDLLITDRSMPGLSGDELAIWYRKRNPAGKVVIMSTMLDDVRADASTRLLEKPFTAEALRFAVKDLLNNRSCTEHLIS